MVVSHAATLVGAPGDLDGQHRLRPAVLQRALAVPAAGRGAVEALEQREFWLQGNCARDSLHNWPVGPGAGERPHVLEVSR